MSGKEIADEFAQDGLWDACASAIEAYAAEAVKQARREQALDHIQLIRDQDDEYGLPEQHIENIQSAWLAATGKELT